MAAGPGCDFHRRPWRWQRDEQRARAGHRALLSPADGVLQGPVPGVGSYSNLQETLSTWGFTCKAARDTPVCGLRGWGCGLPSSCTAHCPPTGPCSSHGRSGPRVSPASCPQTVRRAPSSRERSSLLSGSELQSCPGARWTLLQELRSPSWTQRAGSERLSPFIFVFAFAPGGGPGAFYGWARREPAGGGPCARSCEGLGVAGPVGG